jgi:integrase
MLIAANTTCRPCEISGLQLGHIHSEGPWPYITISRVTTKTTAGERDIPLSQVSKLAIDRLLERAYKLGAEKPEHYLLPAELSRHTKPTDPLYVRRFEGFDPLSDHPKPANGYHLKTGQRE